jgi:hypothetical protein
MNNTKTLAIVAVLMAATLVVGTLAATATTQSAFAYAKKPRQDDNKKTRDNGSGNRNGNTITALKCQNKGSASGWDTKVNQECENLICTHPSSGATCVSEPGKVTPPETATLLVTKIVKCHDDTITTDGCQNTKFAITVADTNPQPAKFSLGDGDSQLVTLGASTYTVSEDPKAGFKDPVFVGDCDAHGQGTIAAGEQQHCTITNEQEEE